MTGLWGGARVAKNNARVAAYGEVDELNCFIGWVLAGLTGAHWKNLRDSLKLIQEELFVVGAILAAPAPGSPQAPKKNYELKEESILRLENAIDAMTSELKPLRRFILPGGGPAGAGLHLARASCRRAERAAVELAGKDKVPQAVLVYLNRLSDYLFTAARWANARSKLAETEWKGL